MGKRELNGAIAATLVALGGSSLLAALPLTPFSWMQISALAVGIVLVCIGIVQWRWLWVIANTSAQGPEPVIATPELNAVHPLEPAQLAIAPQSSKAEISANAAEIISRAKLMTDVQAQAAFADFISKRIAVSGKVIQISELWLDHMSMSIVPDGATSSESIFMVFDKDQDLLKTVLRGETISAIGRVKSIRDGELTLVDCELCRERP